MRIVTATDAVQNLRTVLQNIAAAEGVTVILLSCAKRLNQMIVAVGVHLCKEVGTGLLQLLPQFGLAATIPGASVGLGSVFTSKVWLCIVEQWRCGKLQYLTFQCHSASQGPVTSFRGCFRALVSPRQGLVLYNGVELLDHEVNG